jgi:Ca-activated chloride channel family protein
MKPRPVYAAGIWLLWALVVPLGLVALGITAYGLTEVGTVPLDHPELWWLLLSVPVAGAVYFCGMLVRRRAIDRLTSATLAGLLTDRVQPARQAFRAGLVVSAVAFVAAAIVGPRWGLYLEKQKVRGVDIVVALDVSRSMLANDMEPNRLDRAKRDIRHQLVERPVFQGMHRLGLLAFAGSTSVRVPLTTDLTAFRNRLDMLRVGVVSKGGTAIGNAIRNATDLFVRSPQGATKILLVFTDGEDHEGQPEEAAREAREKHDIRVYTIGVGDPSRTVGVQVPAGEGAGSKPLLHDGQIVFSKMNVETLKDIARSGGGQYAPLEDLYALVTAVAGMKSAELTTEERMRHRPRYPWFLAAALICLGLESTIRERRTTEDLPVRVWQLEAA